MKGLYSVFLTDNCILAMQRNEKTRNTNTAIAYFCIVEWLDHFSNLLVFTVQNKSVPIVPYTERQEVMLKDHVFMFLMEKLGLHFPEDSGGAFPRIPHFWTPADLMAAAKKLSDIDFGKLDPQRMILSVFASLDSSLQKLIKSREDGICLGK